MTEHLDASDLSAKQAPHRSGRSLLAYLLPFFICPALLLLAALIIVPSRWFALRSGNPYIANMGYAMELHGQRCDVAVWGDSTAMVGINPARVEARTGLRTCNIAEFVGVNVVQGTWLLDQFLRNNPAPRFLVFLTAPENLQRPADWTKYNVFEAITYRVHAQRDAGTALALLQHPLATISWAETGMRMSLMRAHSHPMDASALRTRVKTQGQFPLLGLPEVQCDKERRRGDPDPAYVAALRARYSRPGTTVLVDATPIPPCDPGMAYFNRVLPGVIDDAPLPHFPLNVYIRGDRLHTNRQGSQMLSDLLSDQLLTLMHKQ